MQAAAAAAAAVEDLASQAAQVVGLRAAEAEEERMTGCCHIAVLTGESKAAVVAYQHLRSVAGCM